MRQTERPPSPHRTSGAGLFTVVGEALVDLVESKATASTGTAQTYSAHAGGSPYNVAITLARLGADVAMVGRSGNDAFGRLLVEKARASGVGFQSWQTVDVPTTLAIASLAVDGSAQYDFYLDGTAGLGWDDGLVDLVPSSGIVHFGSVSSWRPPSAPVVQAIQRRVYESGAALVSYDPNVRPALIADRDTARISIERCISAAHLIKSSDEDAAYLYPEMPIADVAQRWCALGAVLVVVTLGSDGAVAFDATGELLRVPGERITVADTVGAGDSFAGGLLAALASSGVQSPAELRITLQNKDDLLAKAVSQAVLVSAMTCEGSGANPPTRAELDARLASRASA